VADTQLQFSQLSYTSLSKTDVEAAAEPGTSQAVPLAILSNSESDDEASDLEQANDSEPRRSGRVTKKSRALESQQWQIDHGLIPAPSARANARALNAKKRRQIQTSQLVDEFELLE
jgi:hypothetical protein